MHFNEDEEAHEQDLLEGYQAECERLEKKLNEYRSRIVQLEEIIDILEDAIVKINHHSGNFGYYDRKKDNRLVKFSDLTLNTLAAIERIRNGEG